VAANSIMQDGAAFYVIHATTETKNFWDAVIAARLDIHQSLAWNKNQFVMGRQDYQWKHEGILYGWKAGAAHTWNGAYKQATVLDEEPAALEAMTSAQLIEIIQKLTKERSKIQTSVIDIDRPKRSKEHPTMKPIKLLSRLILNSSEKGATVYDGFGGSGSTLIACEQTGRRCDTIELDPVYCDIIVNRYRQWSMENGKTPLITKNGAKT